MHIQPSTSKPFYRCWTKQETSRQKVESAWSHSGFFIYSICETFRSIRSSSGTTALTNISCLYKRLKMMTIYCTTCNQTGKPFAVTPGDHLCLHKTMKRSLITGVNNCRVRVRECRTACRLYFRSITQRYYLLL